MTAIQPDSNFRGAFAHKTLLNWTEGLLAVLLGFASLFLLYEAWQYGNAEVAALSGEDWSESAIAGAARLGVIGVLLPALVGVYAFTAAARQGFGLWIIGALAGLGGLGYVISLVLGAPTLADMLALTLTNDPEALTPAQILGLGGVAFMVLGLLVLAVTASFGGLVPIFAVALAVAALPAALYVTAEYGDLLPVDLGTDLETVGTLYAVILAVAFVFACLDWCLRQVFAPVVLVLVLSLPVLFFFGLSAHSVALVLSTDPSLAGFTIDGVVQTAQGGGSTAARLSQAFATPEITGASLGFLGLFGVLGFVVALMAARRGMVPMLIGLFIALVAAGGFVIAALGPSIAPLAQGVLAELFAEFGQAAPAGVLTAFEGNVPAFGLGALAVALLGALGLNRLASR